MSKKTFHTTLFLNFYQKEIFDELGSLFAKIEHKLLNDINNQKDQNDLAKLYQKDFQINKRYFNSVLIETKRIKESQKETRNLYIKDKESKIKELNKIIKKYEKLLIKPNKKNKLTKKDIKFRLHQKKRKLNLEIYKLNKYKQLKDTNCTKVLFRRNTWKKQYQTTNHKEWLKEWKEIRTNSFYFVGDKKNNFGNYNCQYIDGKLKIRLPKYYKQKYLTIENVQFPYGQENINHAIDNQSLFWKFKRENGIWYAHCTIENEPQQIISNGNNGCIGIDFNQYSIDYSYCDKEGNIKYHNTLHINLTDKSSEQREHILSTNLDKIVKLAVELKCPIAYEDLDFSKKKSKDKEYNKMVNEFAYKKYKKLVIDKCNKFGIQSKPINPAYSSIIGCAKYMKMYGLSSGCAASLVIGRRYYVKFREKTKEEIEIEIEKKETKKKTINKYKCVKSLSERIPSNITFVITVDMAQPIWKQWKQVNKWVSGNRFRRHCWYSGIDVETGVRDFLELT